MCGIVGHYRLGLSPEEGRALLRRMAAGVAHRGPDDEGAWSDGLVGLGLRRLSIVDLPGGHQPLANEDGSRWIAFNGEIYNHRELRANLEARGHRFATRSDTEAILHQFEEDGAACLARLNGMFALAIYDRRDGSLLLARDRLGVKPLYYWTDGRRVLFASEIKGILAAGIAPREVRPAALWDYLTFRYVPEPQTVWEGVSKLPPAHALALGPGGGVPEPRRWWEIPWRDGAPPLAEAERNRRFAELFLDAVRLRLVADVPVGILLSGGLDSSAVAAAVAEVHDAPVRSFAVAFADSPETSELPFARLAARHAGTEHEEVVIGEREVAEFLPRLVHFADEPLADPTAVPLYYLARRARTRVKVVLSGEGSDEVLGGYDLDRVVRRWALGERLRRLPLGWGAGLPARAAGLVSRAAADRLARLALPPGERLRRHPPAMTEVFGAAAKAALWRGPAPAPDSLERLRAALDRCGSREPLHRLLHLLCQDWLAEDLLMKADKMTMAASLELRVPFLDYRIVEWAAGLPPDAKVRRGPGGRYETKHLLRAFARTRLPAPILARPKRGFPVPVYAWLSGRLAPLARDLLAPPDARLAAWLDAGAVARTLREGTAPAAPLAARQRVWSLMVLEQWLRVWRP